MDRVQYIRDVQDIPSYEVPSIFAALVSCLDEAEACSLFDVSFRQYQWQRQIILRRIERDLEIRVRACHSILFTALIKAYADLPYNKKRICASCLVRFYPKMPRFLRKAIVNLLMNSPQAPIRQRAYEALEKNWRWTLVPIIQKAWESHYDRACAHIIIDHFPVEYLVKNLNALQRRVKRSRYLTKLYMRVGEKDPARLRHLRKVDGVTFAYVSAKLRRSIRSQQALDLYREYRKDERLGLLIWCFGQMKLWDVLIRIREEADRDARRPKRSNERPVQLPSLADE